LDHTFPAGKTPDLAQNRVTAPVVIGCLVSRMPQPAPHRPRQALTSQATVMQTPTVWLPARMQHGRAGKVIGCLHERADLAPLLSTLMQRVRSRRPGSAETPDACVSSGPGWEEHLASRGPGSTAGAGYQTRRNCMRRAWPEWSQATKQPQS
jgi:hypothetical protein